MNTQQIITIRPDGSIAGLQHKKGKGLDLRQLGKAAIRRITKIIFCENSQKWFIEWEPRYIAEKREVLFSVWQSSLFNQYEVQWSDFKGEENDNKTIMFDDYDDAVKAEVALVQSMQLAGDSKKIF